MAMASVNIVIGPARSGKTDLLLAGYRRHLTDRRPGTCVWLAPTQRSAADVRGRLLAAGQVLAVGQGACLAPGVMTFEQLARQVLATADEPIRPLSAAMKRHLIRRLIARAGEDGTLETLAPIAGAPGLVEELSSWISELKRHEVWPEQLTAALVKTGGGPHERELAVLYERYQAELLAHQLYDAEGQFWSARDLLTRGRTGALSRVRYVVADGFTDFTHTQHEILALLAGWIDELHISLIGDGRGESEAPVPRDELFAKSRATLETLQRRHRNAKLISRRAETGGWPAMEAIGRELFADPRRGAVVEDPLRVEIHPASRALAEIEFVARTIKKLLTEGDATREGVAVKPAEIAVVFRRAHEAGPLVREVFAEYGIPMALEAGRPLRDAPLIAALIALVSLDVEDWPFARVLALLANSYFQPDLPAVDTVREAAEWTVREMQVPRGRRALLTQRERLVARGKEEKASEAMKARAERADTARPWFEWLAALVDSLPERATIADWLAALERVVERASEPTSFDRKAWRRAGEIMRDVGALAGRLDENSVLDRREMLAVLNDVATREQLPADHDETGRVRVLNAASVRSLRIPYLFVADLAERSFPAGPGESRLYSEVEHQRLISAGLPLAPRSELAADEMLLFYEVVTRATRRLTLSYPAWDAAGQPLLPSPFVLEVIRLFGRERLSIADSPDLSPLPQTDVPRSPAEWRILAVDSALRGDSGLLAGLTVDRSEKPVALGLLGSLEAIADRRRYGEFGRYEGLLTSDAAKTSTARMFSPDHTWSATSLEQLAHCPFRFYAQRVLGLTELPDLALDTDARRRGSIVHELLARLHRQLNDAAGGPATLADVDAASVGEAIDALLLELLAVADSDLSIDAALRLIDRRRLTRDLASYPELHARYDKTHAALDAPPRPAFFEVSFGLDPPSAGQGSTTRPLAVESAAGPIKIAGQIDRIDLGQAAGRTIVNVIDYKSGRLPAAKVDKLMAEDVLQLPLYAWAAEKLILADRQAAAWGIGYWGTGAKQKDRGFRNVAALSSAGAAGLAVTDDWQALQAWIIQRVAELVLAARGGQFPMASRDDECTSRCEFSNICRVNQTRALEKTWTPPSTTRD